ncbi:MAG: DUF1501 domain-containing protein [Planctomycetota bacterium]|nr:DUF1501 domain-containing protein [Planctomycetota bacterium]MDA1212843.1 DUF1501 domain-containing protein [Planctomycetota bacterium]
MIPSSLLESNASIRRRDFLRFGLGGFVGLSLPNLLRLRAVGNQSLPTKKNSVIVIWAQGGASHIETYDPKPDAPAEYRGPYRSIETRTPGLRFCELLPQHAAIADKFTVLRSHVHSGFCHDDGPQQIFTGHKFQGRRQKPDEPDLFSITSFLRYSPERDLPNYIGLNPIPYLGSAYLGPAHEPFAVYSDPNDPQFEVPNIGLKNSDEQSRLGNRIQLRTRLDRLDRQIDQFGNMEALDRFEAQAWNMLTGPSARKAFDISQEDPRIRERYGRNLWGQQCLLGRRLVEAGVEMVTISLNGPLCGRVGNWDDHAVNHHVFDAMKHRAPPFDQAVSALIEDIHNRGLDENVLVVVGGDFGRTPKISHVASSGGGVASAPAGTIQPGRDHWPLAMSFLFSGGGISPGQVIGATDVRGEHAVERIVGVQDFVATIYHHLGIDAAQTQIINFAGRPIPLVQEGKPIPELMGRA